MTPSRKRDVTHLDDVKRQHRHAPRNAPPQRRDDLDVTRKRRQHNTSSRTLTGSFLVSSCAAGVVVPDATNAVDAAADGPLMTVASRLSALNENFILRDPDDAGDCVSRSGATPAPPARDACGGVCRRLATTPPEPTAAAGETSGETMRTGVIQDCELHHSQVSDQHPHKSKREFTERFCQSY